MVHITMKSEVTISFLDSAEIIFCSAATFNLMCEFAWHVGSD